MTSPLVHIEVLFQTNDPRGAAILKELNAIPEYSAERAEAEWFLYSMLARVAARRADSIRSSQAAANRRRRSKK